MRLKIGFDESSKAVTAHVTVEDDVVTDEEQQALLSKCESVYLNAQRIAHRESMRKM